MLKKILSAETKPGAYFRRIDWTAFWGATIIAFLVYFFTLGPSVGLEDSGELATAGDHLGVPHPPGYPFWTLCSWIFCRLLSWVTYMGHPTPAYAISLLSAIFGAFAAGCTSMLICRSASDMLEGGTRTDGETKPTDVFALAGGLGGSLAFAFSPVEWSQSTIVEIYSLNALFLMFVFLLTYRWMRKPSDKVLWTLAFAFGLGLTNYQVLLLAAVPLAITIFLRNIKLFRDFLLIIIPMGLTAMTLSIGSKFRASSAMQSDAINKFLPVGAKFDALGRLESASTASCPSEVALWIGIALLVAAPIVATIVNARRGGEKARMAGLWVGLGGAAVLALAGTAFTEAVKWTAKPGGIDYASYAPLIEPSRYALIGALLAASAALSLGAVFAPKDAELRDASVWQWLAASAAPALLAILYVGAMQPADSAGYGGEPFSWTAPTLIMTAGVLAIFALTITTRRGLAFAIPVASVQIVAFTLLCKGAMNGLTSPHSWWFFWPIAWNLVMLALAYVALPNGRTVALATLFAELGVSFYAYMPVVSDLRNPPMNWGYPRTWDGFKHAITRGQYEAIKATPLFGGSIKTLFINPQFLEQLTYYFSDLRMQFTLVAATLALLPFTLWKVTFTRRRPEGGKGRTFVFNALYPAAALYVLVAGFVIESELRNDEPLWRIDKYLIAILGVLVLVGLAVIGIKQLMVVLDQVFGRKAWSPSEAPQSAASGGAPKADGGSEPEGGSAPGPAVKVDFATDNVCQQWLVSLGVCFAMMSIALVALAQVKGDIQDGFIQKVKFISSHAIFAMWIGYGLAIGILVVKRATDLLVGNVALRRLIVGAATIAAALAFLIPIYENYTNDKLVFAMGSAEQNGHTFGWQFGAYQLEGANQIARELKADEEPLPNPAWPEAMEPHSIFFGGTDPGRFVPTYMIYSADCRPDVYLITQNALADDTYMSVERDLYGDDIWIPSKEDSSEAFRQYVSSLSPEERVAKGVVEVNGRVQVTGALSVMDINAILTKMMFDHEHLRHAFYVEESYVISWMYPYMTPHGLIMKINPEHTPISDSMATNDMEFWDWYWRRLMRDPAFRRDFPAQKAFSKLRAAIAGLYREQGRFNLSAIAYREACHMYPASPEASFRYCQEILLGSRKWDQIIDILDYTDRVDPNNKRTGPFRNYVSRIMQITGQIDTLQKEQLEARSQNKPFPPDKCLLLAHALLEIDQKSLAAFNAREAIKGDDVKDFSSLFNAARILSRCGQRGDAGKAMLRAKAVMPANTPGGLVREMGAVLAEGGFTAEAVPVYNQYLRASPNDVEAWLQLALLQHASGQLPSAENAILMAMHHNQDAALKIINSSPLLISIANPLFQRLRQQQEMQMRQMQDRTFSPLGPRR